MEKSVIPFSFESHSIRAINKDGDIWFVASDVCAVLELSNVTMALQNLDDDEAALSIIEVRSDNGVSYREAVGNVAFCAILENARYCNTLDIPTVVF